MVEAVLKTDLHQLEILNIGCHVRAERDIDIGFFESREKLPNSVFEDHPFKEGTPVCLCHIQSMRKDRPAVPFADHLAADESVVRCSADESDSIVLNVPAFPDFLFYGSGIHSEMLRDISAESFAGRIVGFIIIV